MYRRTSAQDVTLCDMCDKNLIKMHCDTCDRNFCTTCVGEHMASDEFVDHKVVKFRSMKSNPLYPDCTFHNKELCVMFCNHCDTPICLSCLSMDQHQGHKYSKVSEVLAKKKLQGLKEQSELNQTIYPTYMHIASDIQDIITQLEKGYEDLTTAITKHGEDLHKEINKGIQRHKMKVKKMKAQQMQTLQKHLDEVNEKISDIKDDIDLFDYVLDSNDISKIRSVEGNVKKYRKLPEKIVPFLPKFTLTDTSLCELSGNLSSFSYSSDESGYYLGTEDEFTQAESSSKVKKLLDEPEIVATIQTDYKHLKNVACVNGDSFWTCGNGNIMKLYSIEQESKLKSIKTLSGSTTSSITVTPSGDIIFADYQDESVNIVKNEKIETVIRLNGWKPRGVCGTLSGDLLVTMVSEDKEHSKVVCYSGSKEKQSIQYSDKGQALYQCPVYIAVNKNQDICVTDHRAHAIVVVNKSGKLHFRYMGKSCIQRNEPFYPQGITTDSQSHILIANSAYGNSKNYIHIIDQDGQFISYIDCGLDSPWGICTDTDNYLFVADYWDKKVKKIKYQL